MSQVFVSYSSRDIVFARHLKRLLEAAQFTVWIDESRLTTSKRWWTTIERAIEVSAAVIVVMSPNSRISDWVERELLYAEKLGKPVFPILLAGDEWPRLANIQYADMRTGVDAQLSDSFVRELRAVVDPSYRHATRPAISTLALTSSVHRAETILRRPLPRRGRSVLFLVLVGIGIVGLGAALVRAGLGQSWALNTNDLFGSAHHSSGLSANDQPVAAIIAGADRATEPNMRLIYDDDAVLLINSSNQEVDASQLVFEQSRPDGPPLQWQAVDWGRANAAVSPSRMSAGGCYQLVRYGGTQARPSRSVCALLLGWFRSSQESRYFWRSPDPDTVFTVRLLGRGEPLATCEIGAGKCAFYLPDVTQ